CRMAAQVLRTGHPAPRHEWAMDAIRRCDASGPAVLASVWREAAPSDTTGLDLLFNATRDFNDRRVVDAVAAVARRTGAPETTRIYAFALLFNYAVPGRYLNIEQLLQPGEFPPRIRYFTHDDRGDSTRAILGDLRPEVSEVLRSVAAAEPSSRVGIAAATVLRRLEDVSRWQNAKDAG
ncbi:MAG TPA: hypothetical protein VLK84_11365, partial [Longimicrobium sp.]|nr:hypothetical protein [Longimicrobium sp.]